LDDGGGQKAHILSPLDIRLSCYLLAMFNFNHEVISYLNIFNNITKERYLSYKEKPLIRFLATKVSEIKPTVKFIITTDCKEYKSVTLTRMPDYSKDRNLGEY